MGEGRCVRHHGLRNPALTIHTHVARTTQEAQARFEPFYRHYWKFVGGLLAGSGPWPPFDFDSLLSGPGVCGSPDEVADRIGQWRELLDLDRHLVMFDLGGMDVPTLTDAIELFGNDVIPQLK